MASVRASPRINSAVPAGTEWVCDPDPGLSSWAAFNQTYPDYGFRELVFVRRAWLQPCRKSLAHEPALAAEARSLPAGSMRVLMEKRTSEQPLWDFSTPRTKGCPISRSFFARCGRRGSRSAASGGPRTVGWQPWSPTSREKRARYGAPFGPWGGQNSATMGSHADSKSPHWLWLSGTAEAVPFVARRFPNQLSAVRFAKTLSRLQQQWSALARTWKQSRKGRLKLAALLITLCFLVAIIQPGLWGQESARGSSASDATTGVIPPVSPALAPPIPKGAVVLDHVVAVINGSVILQSDVTEEMGYAFLQPFSAERAQHAAESTAAPHRPRPHPATNARRRRRSLLPRPRRSAAHCPTARFDPRVCAVPLPNRRRLAGFSPAKGLTEEEVDAHWAQRMLDSLVYPVALRLGRAHNPG